MQLEKKQKIELLITAVMILLLIPILANLKNVRKPARARLAAGGGLSGAPPDRSGRRIGFRAESRISGPGLFKRLEGATAGMVLKRDPFSRAGTAGSAYGAGKAAQSGLALTGILWDSNSPLAIINDITLKTGDSIGASKITRISQDKVFLSDGNNNITLTLE